MLEVKNLRKSHGSKVILKDLSFSIDRGKIALFLGGSGVGKSTLLRVLNTLESYDSGEISLDGKLLDHVDHGVGMVFQHFNLFENLSVQENITLALRKVQGKTPTDADLIAHKLLERYGLSDKANKPVKTLSGGQKQRLAIARTLALDPKIVCLDEPTSALDPLKTRQVARDIEAIAADNRIVLLSTHDVQLVSQLEATIFLMEDGRIVESCTTSQYADAAESYPHLSRFLGGDL